MTFNKASDFGKRLLEMLYFHTLVFHLFSGGLTDELINVQLMSFRLVVILPDEER